MAEHKDTREHERIDIEMATRMWLTEAYKGKPIEFEGFAKTLNLAIGGTFLESSYLLPVGFPLNLEMRINDTELLIARGQIVHIQGEKTATHSGMGIMFTEVDAENRERLLRFFISDRIRSFYTDRFVVEFPHLENALSLKDVALVINLWEDKEGRLTELHRGDREAKSPARRAAASARVTAKRRS